MDIASARRCRRFCGPGGGRLRLYLASSFQKAATVQAMADALERDGHSIPDKWWGQNADRGGESSGDAAWHGQPEIRALAARHWLTIRGVDALVLVGHLNDGDDRCPFTGANVEVGYALALGKPVVVLGRVKRSAMYADCIFAETPGAMLRLLRCMGGEDRSQTVAEDT